MNKTITLLNSNVVHEFKTIKAANKYAARVYGQTSVIRATSSFFGFDLNTKGYIYQVIKGD